METGNEWLRFGKREGGKNEGALRSEVESGVIKIHPTVQTKGGMKKGENAGESECWGGLVRFGVKRRL